MRLLGGQLHLTPKSVSAAVAAIVIALAAFDLLTPAQAAAVTGATAAVMAVLDPKATSGSASTDSDDTKP